jgi:hypothetical protein
MRTRPAIRWLVGLSVVIGLATPSAAAPNNAPDGSITISGRTGGYADIVLTRKAHFTIADGVVIKGGNKYAGYCMQPWRLADRARAIPCGVVINAVDKQWQQISGGMVTDLLPGKYRVYLLADGPATVTLPMHDIGRHLRLRAGGNNPRATLTFTDATGPAGLEAGRWRQRPHIRDNAAIWVGWYFVGRVGARAETWDMCIAPAGGECVLIVNTFGDGRWFNVGGGPGVNGGWMGAATAFGPDHNRDYNGYYDVMLTNVATDVDQRAQGFLLDVDFGSGPPAIR